MKKNLMVTLLITLLIGILGINTSANENTEIPEDAVVYIDGKEISSVTAKLVSDDAYLCAENFFDHYGFEVETDYAVVRICVVTEDEDGEEYTASLGRFSHLVGDKYSFYCYDSNIELCTKYLDLNSSYISTDEYGEKEFKFDLSKAWIRQDSKHHYVYYKDLQNIWDFDLVSEPEINTVAIYKSEKVPENITLYDKKGNAKEVCALFKDKYIELGYKEDLDDVLIIPKSKVVSADGIKVSLNGGLLEFDVLPTTINDRTMVPLRTIFEALSATVDWNEHRQ